MLLKIDRAWDWKREDWCSKEKGFWFIRFPGEHIFGEEIGLMHHRLKTFLSIDSFLSKTPLGNGVLLKGGKA